MKVLFSMGVALTALAPCVAEACAVCSGYANEEVRHAFVSATAFMTATPLLLIGAVGWWVFRQLRAAEQRDASSAGDKDR